MGEESWPENVVRSKGKIDLGDLGFLRDAKWDAPEPPHLGRIEDDGPRVIICSECGKPVKDGNVVHRKPQTYAFVYKGETFYLERHLCLGCARKRGLVP